MGTMIHRARIKTMIWLRILDRKICETYRRIRYYKAHLVLEKAIENADSKNEKNGVRYWVIPTPEGVLAILNWQDARAWKERGILPKELKNAGMYNISFYWTRSNRSDSGRGFSRAKSFVDMKKYDYWWKMTH